MDALVNDGGKRWLAWTLTYGRADGMLHVGYTRKSLTGYLQTYIYTINAIHLALVSFAVRNHTNPLQITFC